MSTTAATRLVRGLVVGIMTVILGSTSHVLAGGSAPSEVTLLTMAAVAVLGASALMGTQASMLRLALMTIGGQALLHHALMFGAGGSHHTHGAAPIDISVLQAGHTSAVTATNTQMTLFHALAALAVAWWLARGERTLWTLIGLLATSWSWVLRWAFAGVATSTADLAAASSSATTTPPRRLHQQVWHSGTCDRGPPTRGPIRRVAMV